MIHNVAVSFSCLFDANQLYAEMCYLRQKQDKTKQKQTIKII